MAVTSGSEGVVFGPAGCVALNRDTRPVVDGVAQASIARVPPQHHTTLAAPSRHRRSPGQSAQSMIVSSLQSFRSFCKQRGKDDPADAWERIEDRHVTLFQLLSPCAHPVFSCN